MNRQERRSSEARDCIAHGEEERRLRALNDRAARRVARKLIAQGDAYEDERHEVRLTKQGERRLAHSDPALLARLLAREGVS